MFTKQFGKYLCDGDSVVCTVDGVTYEARIVHDTDTRIEDYDCYDKEAVDAWNNDEWHYYGLVIDAERDGWRKEHLASLWGIEGNFPGSDNSYFLEVANDLLADAIAIVEKRETENA